MHAECSMLSSEIAQIIVSCVENAVGDDIRSDIRRNRLKTTNSVPARIWDLMNTNLIDSLELQNCTLAIAHRGPWQMLVIYERATHHIITLMREKRFSELQKNQHKRKQMHYLDIFAKHFNKDLISEPVQTSFLQKTFTGEEQLAELVRAILSDLNDDVKIVRNHILVLFETAGYQLTHIRAVKVTSNLEVANNCDEDWSKYISTSESSVVETISAPNAPEDNPRKGLVLKTKAIARKTNNLKEKKSSQTELKQS